MAADLSGLLVISVEHAVAAPCLSGRLAEAGARVIKVERPEGDFARSYDHLVHGESAYFVWLNHGKESICLDLRQTTDLDLLKRMIAKADVFVQNLAPGAAARLGVGSEAMRVAHPRLIYVSISGYGEAGPYREQKAYDMLIALPEQAPKALLADKGYDADAIRTDLARRNIQAVIPGRSNRRIKIEHDRALYRERNHVERFFGRLKINRAIATRYDQLAESFLSMVHIAAARYWLKFVHAA